MNRKQRDFNRETAKELNLVVNFDKYGNPIDGSSLPNCCFPDCGCDGARNCMADSGASFASCVVNIEKRRI